MYSIFQFGMKDQAIQKFNHKRVKGKKEGRKEGDAEMASAERSRWRLYEDYDDGRLANDEGRRRERFAEASRAAARHGGSAAAAAAAAAVAAAVTIATVAVAAAVAATEWKTTTLAEKGMEGKSSDGGSSKLVAPRKYLRDRATAESASNAKEMRSDGCC
ncbi:hypothetical protein V1477_016155 [Vespula maculifrons]|uniref:Uncharacterized protein n=1 Tax=Vespula maculifrons TaxID=7453 RepID=A0ABD2BC79_VESMC